MLHIFYLEQVPDGSEGQPLQQPVLLGCVALTNEGQPPELEEHPLLVGDVVVVEEVGAEDLPELCRCGAMLRTGQLVPPEQVLFRAAALHRQPVAWQRNRQDMIIGTTFH